MCSGSRYCGCLQPAWHLPQPQGPAGKCRESKEPCRHPQACCYLPAGGCSDLPGVRRRTCLHLDSSLIQIRRTARGGAAVDGATSSVQLAVGTRSGQSCEEVWRGSSLSSPPVWWRRGRLDPVVMLAGQYTRGPWSSSPSQPALHLPVGGMGNTGKRPLAPNVLLLAICQTGGAWSWRYNAKAARGSPRPLVA
jgi:hypothetical protein